MSQLELLKGQIDTMDKRIKEIKADITVKGTLIETIQTKKAEIDLQLLEEQNNYEILNQNYAYLCEVKTDTTQNYLQIEEAANTLLDILKTKCGSI